MALSGLQIQKLLPKTNCKECGSNTCLAFAMRLAAKKADLSECPYASEEAKQVLGAASEPPVKAVKLGVDGKFAIGEETVLYRHEKTFVHQTLLAVNVNDTDAQAIKTLEAIRDYKLERVGETLVVEAVSITQTLPDNGPFLALVKNAAEITGRPLIIRGLDIASAESAAKLAGAGSVICGVTADNSDDMRRIAEENSNILAVTASSIDELTEITAKIKDSGFNNIIVEFKTHSMAEAYQTNTISRTAAIKKGIKALGYASICYVNSGNMLDDTALAVNEINKYGGICVLPGFEASQLVALMTLRQNIYTDPQKPIQVEPKVYEIGEPDRNSPVFVTTNFSLTYFLVSGEIENAGISAWLVIPECEGLSVLTAWAAGKFSGTHIAKFVKDVGLEEMVDTRSIIIPGYVSQISGELEESLPGWKVLVGPQEAADLEPFIKNVIKP